MSTDGFLELTGGNNAPVPPDIGDVRVYPDITNKTIKAKFSDGTVTDLGPSGDGATKNHKFVTIGSDAILTQERALTSSPSIKVVDNGANSIVFLEREEPKKFGVICENDFAGALGSFATASSGTAASALLASNPNKIGTMQLSCGTTSSGRAAIYSNVSLIAPPSAGGFLYCDAGASLGSASNGTDTYIAIVGFGDNSASSTQTDGAFFRYTHTESGGRWSCVTRTGGVETVVDSLVTPSFESYQALKVQMNDSASVSFYIDGALAATIDTNIPGATSYMGLLAGVFKSSGTNVRTLTVDWFNAYFYGAR